MPHQCAHSRLPRSPRQACQSRTHIIGAPLKCLYSMALSASMPKFVLSTSSHLSSRVLWLLPPTPITARYSSAQSPVRRRIVSRTELADVACVSAISVSMPSASGSRHVVRLSSRAPFLDSLHERHGQSPPERQIRCRDDADDSRHAERRRLPVRRRRPPRDRPLGDDKATKLHAVSTASVRRRDITRPRRST